MSELNLVVESTLAWPVGWPRTPWPRQSPFARDRSFATARNELLRELRLWGARGQVVLHCNVDRSRVAQPKDRGVAVVFLLEGQERQLACDHWDRVECNLHAIAMHISALRACIRYRVGTPAQLLAAYRALPAAAPWWVTALGVSATPTREEVDTAFQRLALQHHPDRGGQNHEMGRLNAARDAAYAWLLEHRP